MKNSITLFLEINKTSLVFIVGEHDAQNVKITYKEQIPIIGVENNRVTDYEKLSNVIKENIYKIEQNFKYTFKELVIILENFDPSL